MMSFTEALLEHEKMADDLHCSICHVHYGEANTMTRFCVGRICFLLCNKCWPNRFSVCKARFVSLCACTGEAPVLMDWVAKTEFEIPNPKALFNPPFKASINTDGKPDPAVHLVQSSEDGTFHLAVNMLVTKTPEPGSSFAENATRVETEHALVCLENLARNNCDLRAGRPIVNIDNFDLFVSSMDNKSDWLAALNELINVEEANTVLCSFCI